MPKSKERGYLMKRNKDIPFEFWKKYDKADILEREKMLKPILKNILPLFKLKEEKLRKRTLQMLLLGYFDDLLDYSYSKKH